MRCLMKATAVVAAMWWCATWGSGASSVRADSDALFNNSTVPGWLQNINNPLVRVAFPDAERVYVELHPEIPGLSKSGPAVSLANPSVTIPPVAVPDLDVSPMASVEAGAPVCPTSPTAHINQAS